MYIEDLLTAKQLELICQALRLATELCASPSARNTSAVALLKGNDPEHNVFVIMENARDQIRKYLDGKI